MHRFSFRYSFTQFFSVPAEKAYKWCTDFRSDDHALMSVRGRRNIEKILEDTLILTDTTYHDKTPIVKQKLVRLDPAQHSWTNTHLSGLNKYSQFLYRIAPRGANASTLEFVGLQLNESRTKVTPEEVASIARRVKDGDVDVWKRLALAMEKELGTLR